MKKISCDARSFNEIGATYELFLLTCEVKQSGKMTPEIAEKISLLQKDIKFEKLARARREYEASDMPSERWPTNLQGRTFFEWEYVTRKALGMEIPLHLKVSCAEFIKRLEAKEETINLGTITGTTKNG